MGIVKHRPQVRLMVQPEITPGQTVRARIVVEAKRDVPVQCVRVAIRGRQRRHGGAIGAIVALHAEPMATGELRAGTTELPFVFTLPAWAPASYSGRTFGVYYTASVHVGIPWWPDRHADFELNVVDAHAVAPAPEPVIVSTRPAGPIANEAHVEVSLATRHVAQGDVLSGAVALGNVSFNRFQAIDLRLVASERTEATAESAAAESHAYALSLPVVDPTEGQTVPFRLRVPPDAPVSRRSFGGYIVEWKLHVRARIGWGSDIDLRIPLTVLPRRLATAARDNLRAVPSVGSERASKAWTEAGARHGLTFVDATLHGTIGGATVHVRRDHRGRGGIYLVAELSYPSLGLDLSVVPASFLGPRASEGVQLGNAKWDDAHRVTARERAQLVPAAKLLAPALTQTVNVQMDDTRAVLERSTSGLDRKALLAFTDAIAQLALALEPARTAAGPPAAVRDDMASWHQLAAQLAGTLRVTDVHITAHVLGCDVTIDTHFDSDATLAGTTVTLRRALPGDTHHVWTADAPLPAGTIDAPARVALDRATRGARTIDIDPTGIVAEYTARPSAAQVQALAQLAAALSTPSAPYR